MNNSSKIITIASAALYLSAALTFAANSDRVAIIDGFAGEAGKPLSADSGKRLFEAKVGGGKPDTPSCTTCHTPSPLNAGQTRAGKPIEPMAVSKTPDRFTDVEKVTKWFRRNCNSVLGRECTPQEKGDFLTFMTNQ